MPPWLGSLGPAPPGPRPWNHSNHWLGPPGRLWWSLGRQGDPEVHGRELEAGTKWKSFPYFWWLISNGYIDSVDGFSWFRAQFGGLPSFTFRWCERNAVHMFLQNWSQHRSDHSAFWLQYIQKTGASTSKNHCVLKKRMVTPLSSEGVSVLGSGQWRLGIS